MEIITQLLIEEKFLYKQLILLLEKDPDNDVKKVELKRAIEEKDLKIKHYFHENKKNTEERITKLKNFTDSFKNVEKTYDVIFQQINSI